MRMTVIIATMIINSKFKDHYDFVAHQYRDKKVVYNRKTEFYNYRGTGNKDRLLRKFIDEFTWSPITEGIRGSVRFSKKGECNMLIIGGKPYPFTRIEDEFGRSKWDFKNPYFHFDKKKNQKSLFFYNSKSKLVSGERRDDCTELCQKYAPIILIMGDHFVRGGAIELNPQLKEYSPPVDVCQITQDIMAVLTPTEPKIPEMSNADKIAARGFDKHSFRPTSRK